MYWEQIVWPAYVDAHMSMFPGGDLQHGTPVSGYTLVEGTEISMDQAVDICCRMLV